MKPGRDHLRIAGLALCTAAVTSAGAAMIAGTPVSVVGGVAYFVVAVATIFLPGALAVQVIGGQLLAASLLLAPEPPPLPLLLPLVIGVIVTAELIALAARVRTALTRSRPGGLRRIGAAALVGAAVYATTAAAGGRSVPSAFVAIVIASAACAALALALAEER